MICLHKKDYIPLTNRNTICSTKQTNTFSSCYKRPLSLLPTERRCHVTAGVAKQANTSSVPLKWVRWGLATAWPRHWPHIRTWPLWVLAADVWLVWHAATSTILVAKGEWSTSKKCLLKQAGYSNISNTVIKRTAGILLDRKCVYLVKSLLL